ncbi:ATP-binding protein [Streptomyces sp. NPDC006012]|uniref:ATP-binding protein n=1 Tax=Streptomyces sp. NPDC006012 TaxID=3364739 RepID=UPI003685E3F4
MITIAVNLAPTGHPAYSQIFPSEGRSVARARALARDAFCAWGLEGLEKTAVLVVSELVTNAVRHARGPVVRVVVDRPQEDRVRVGVIDRDPARLPELHDHGPATEFGRGLLLIDHECEQWGYMFMGPGRRPWGKKVWAQWSTQSGVTNPVRSQAPVEQEASR